MKWMASNLKFFLKNKMRPPKFRDQVGAPLRDFPEWHRSLSLADQPIHAKQPWLSPMAIRCMTRLLSRHCDRLFEYGAGSSTLFAMRHVHEVHGVEHSTEWHALVRQAVAEHVGKQWVGTCIEPEEGASGQFNGFLSTSGEYRGFNFFRYVRYINEFEDDYFDVSVIDGRSRPACLVAAARKTKNILVLDNSERAHYQEALVAVSRRSTLHVFGPSLYTRYFSTTSFISLSEVGDLLIDEMRSVC